MAATDLESWLRGRADAGHRALLVLAGEREAGLVASEKLLATGCYERTLTLSDHPLAPGPVMRTPMPARLVGLELDAVVVDAFSGLDPDVFGAISGTVRGGGLLVLCCPPLAEWPRFEDPFNTRLAPSPEQHDVVSGRYLTRFAARVAADPAMRVANPGRLRLPEAGWAKVPVAPSWRPSHDQRRAIDAICHVVSGQRRRPVVLSADRGRGKSAALGRAAAALLERGARRVVVTAVSAASVDILFRHAHDALDRGESADIRARRVVHEGGVIEFVAPEALASLPPGVDLVIVDEAAALPLARLEEILARFSRIAFATTVHGYEGSGRGFATRFSALLERHTRGWREVPLVEPVRWSPGDPVERWVYDTLLLNAEVSPVPPLGQSVSGPLFGFANRDQLADDEPALRRFFGLLVHAHYRTQPGDLRYLLDAPNLELATVHRDDLLIASAVIAREGGIDSDLATRIRAGRARPRGHMLAETMCAQLGVDDWPGLRGLRVVRIAVHPDCRRGGIGTAFIEYLAAEAVERGLDYIGSSFAVGADVARFWTRAGFTPVWLSGRRNAASGARSLLVVRPLTAPAAELMGHARARFLENFALRLPGLYADEDPRHVALLFAGAGLPAPAGSNLLEAGRFAREEGGFESNFPGLWCAAKWLLSRVDPTPCTPAERDFVVMAVLQQRNLASVSDWSGFSGRKEALRALASIYRKALGKAARTDPDPLTT